MGSAFITLHVWCCVLSYSLCRPCPSSAPMSTPSTLNRLRAFTTSFFTMSSRSQSPCGSGQSSPSLRGADSGYASANNSECGMPEVYFTKPHLQFLNRQLQFLEPQEILRWCITTLPHLFQTTAFGLTGLVQLDMLSKLKIPRPQMVNIHVFKPEGVETAQEFSEKYGDKLWETDDNRYDYLVKVEPAQRAYRELQAYAVLTGRRRSQGGQRGDLDIIEIDEAGLIKINPMANWSFQQIQQYAKENDVPYNALLDRGYKSIGDWHSTSPVNENEDERSGRWKGKQKTECGIHNPRSKYALFLMEQEKKREREALEQALQQVTLEA